MTNLTSYIECPTIYVSLAAGADPQTFAWIEVGAEEEGVPCRQVAGTAPDAVGLAYAAAQGSRLGVGVGIASGKLALHEAHMPPDRPVFAIPTEPTPMLACRLIGGNAGRMVKHMPLRLTLEVPHIQELPERRPPELTAEAPIQLDARRLAETIAQVLRLRGVK
jgi:hypothetical protein